MKSTYFTITSGEIFLLYSQPLLAKATILHVSFHVSFKKALAPEKAL